MMTFAYHRNRALRRAALAVLLSIGAWYGLSYRPADTAIGRREADVAAREHQVRSARAALVSVGPDGMDSLLHQLAADSADLDRRVPTGQEGERVGAEVEAALGRAERSSGIRILTSDPLPPTAEGEFQGEGLALRVVGSYADIGRLLSTLASTPRLTRIRGLRMDARPDSLMAPAYASGEAAMPSIPPGASAEPAPFAATASFHVLWFTRASRPE